MKNMSSKAGAILFIVEIIPSDCLSFEGNATILRGGIEAAL
jgi:hypothetical protein